MSTLADHVVQLRNLSVRYHEAGAGLPLVLVHGLAEDHRSWAPQLANPWDRRLIAYDIRGHGGTTLGKPRQTLEQLGDDLVALLEWIGPASVVGFSLGGTIALWAASERPELVTDVVAVATSSVVGRAAAEWYHERSRLQDIDALSNAVAEDTRKQTVRDGVDVARVVRARLEAMGDGSGYRNAAAAMARLRDAPLTPRLRNIHQPVTVIYATEDAFCPRKAAEIMMDALPNSSLEAVGEAGHLVNVDAPHELTALLRHHCQTTESTAREDA